MKKPKPTFRFERKAASRGFVRVAGIDEAGRGPLAGPVVAAAVWLDPAAIPKGLNDSKVLSASRREALWEELHAVADIGIGMASVEEIDRINILRATELAMIRAAADLRTAPDYLLIDGNRWPAEMNRRGETIVGGDGRVLSIAAASIVAKVRRDRVMVDLAQQHPGYGWERNHGYPTKEHKLALRNLGVTPHHRRSFKPVHNML